MGVFTCFIPIQPCTVLSDTVMTCTTPDVSSANLTLPYKVPKEDYGFILDGVQNFTSLADEGNFQPFEFVSDPVYHKFTGVYPIQDASVKYFEVNVSISCAYHFRRVFRISLFMCFTVMCVIDVYDKCFKYHHVLLYQNGN